MSKSTWKTVYKNQLTLRKELGKFIKTGSFKLKFGRPYLIVSDIASQFYSEAQLELNYLFGKVQTKEQEEGAILHEKMAEDAIIVSLKEQLKMISQAEQIAMIESPLLMKFQGNFIVGVPDIVVFRRGIPVFLFEYKFSKYSVTFPNQQVQAQIYCQMLKQAGYNTDLLAYGIILAPRDLTKESDAVKAIPRKVAETINPDDLMKQNEMHIPFGEINVYLYKFDPDETIPSLEWAVEYWEGKRDVPLTELLKEIKKQHNQEESRTKY